MNDVFIKKYSMTDAQLHYSPENLDLLRVNQLKNPYQNLANAIICLAAVDYQIALKENNVKLLGDLKSFFKSRYCALLSDLDFEVLLSNIEDNTICN